jgi:hypothetical protein
VARVWRDLGKFGVGSHTSFGQERNRASGKKKKKFPVSSVKISSQVKCINSCVLVTVSRLQGRRGKRTKEH